MDKKQEPKKQPMSACHVDKPTNATIPGDMLNDLTEAFTFYDKDETGYISIPHLRNILHNFGFYRLTKRDIDDELRRLDAEFLRRTCADMFFCKNAIAYRWNNKDGKTDEAKDCFHLFDKRDRDVIGFKDVKDVLSTMLDFHVTDQDVEEFINECDPSGSGQVSSRMFIKLYNS